MTLKVLVIDDHPLVQEGVSAALESLADDVTVMAARDAEQGLALAAENPDLDLVLLDLALPGMSGFNLIGKLHERLPSLPVVVLSALEEPENVRHAINAGAMGFVPKSAATRVLIEVLQQVLEGNVTVPLALQSSGPPISHALPGATGETTAAPEPDVALLTLRQLEVLSRVCQGKTNKQIATELGLAFSGWALSGPSVLAAALGLAGGALALVLLRFRGRFGLPAILVWVGLYAVFVAYVAARG